MKTYVIIEDTPAYFHAMNNIVAEIDPKSYLIPNNSEGELSNFRKAYLGHLLEPENPKYINALLEIIPQTTEFFLLDFSLLNYISKRIDNLGGVFRQSFIKQHFPNAKIIFFSAYPMDTVKPFMEPSDIFITKLLPDGNQDFKIYWKERLAFHLT